MAAARKTASSISVGQSPALDATDRELLALLQTNARESVTTLGKKLGVARTTVIARMERLQTSGVITGYSVRLNQATLEKSLQAYVGLSVEPRAGREVLKRLAKMPEIKLVCSVSGEFDYVAWIRADSPNALDRLLDEIGETEGVSKTTTSVVLAERINRGRSHPLTSNFRRVGSPCPPWRDVAGGAGFASVGGHGVPTLQKIDPILYPLPCLRVKPMHPHRIE